jgi:hypothetical protein
MPVSTDLNCSPEEHDMQWKASITGITMDPDSNTPIVLLKTETGDQTLPIWIGLLEATAIATELRNIRFDRPMTHDLFKNFADMLDVVFIRIEIFDLRDNTYYARILFEYMGRPMSLDARPSDAMALALRAGIPIYIDDSLLEKPATGEEPVQILDESREGRKWADYLKRLDPDDFGKYKV